MREKSSAIFDESCLISSVSETSRARRLTTQPANINLRDLAAPESHRIRAVFFLFCFCY